MKTLDTRDLDKRKDELEGMRDSLERARETLEEKKQELEEFEPETELPEHIKRLASEVSDTSPLETFNASKLRELEEAVSDAESDVASYEADFGDEEREELEELETLESEISEWRHGETMIRECDFEDYARELAEDTGAISGSESWPLNYIDWSSAANALSFDYTTVTYQGDEYYVRA